MMGKVGKLYPKLNAIELRAEFLAEAPQTRAEDAVEDDEVD